jgi:hypothetical protein
MSLCSHPVVFCFRKIVHVWRRPLRSVPGSANVIRITAGNIVLPFVSNVQGIGVPCGTTLK